jgi:hypothetical protein
MELNLKRIDEWSNGAVLESGISRFWEKMQGHSVGTITAFRGDQTREKNQDNNKLLLAYLLKMGYGVTKVKGSYIEQYGSPNAKEVGEESFFVSNDKVDGDDGGQLEKDLVKMGEKFDQDSIASKRFGQPAELVGTSGREDSFPGKGKRHSLGNPKMGDLAKGKFFSRVKGRKFAFESLNEMQYPQTINGIRAMEIAVKEIL